MPKKDVSWDAVKQTGNPTRSDEVNGLIKRIRAIDTENGTIVKKRKASTTPVGERKKAAKLPLPAAGLSSPALATGGSSSAGRATEGIQDILHRMQAQNASFIELFGSLSQSLESFKVQLQTSNQAFMAEIANLNQATPAPTIARVVPPAAAASTPDSSPLPLAGTMLEWQYVHPDGNRRRVPVIWEFPKCNLQDVYLLWHVGDHHARICPMKYFSKTDVDFIGKRSRANLGEIRKLVSMIDEEAKRKGKTIMPTMTKEQALECLEAGVSGINFHPTTPGGKTRNITRLKWSTLIKEKGVRSPVAASPKKEPDAEAKAAASIVMESSLPNDWWYMHSDGEKRRVPEEWKFPMVSLEEIYTLWHCGDAANKIIPMKRMQTSDLKHTNKRSRTNLSEVRTIATAIDLKATKEGKTIKSNMSPEEAKECLLAGYQGLSIENKTPDGRARNVLLIKWSSIARLKSPCKKGKSPEEEKEEPEADTELDAASVDAADV